MSEHNRNQPPTKPQFLQPVVYDLASNFSIPADFVKYLEGERCQEVQMRTRKRRQPWVVRIEGRRMMDGWNEFVKENELHVGEFLVFKYEGSLCFDVTVFGPTACEREYSPTANDNDDMLDDDCVTLKSKVNAGISRRRSYGSSRIGNDCYVGTMGRSYMKSLYFPIGFILDNQLKEAKSGILIQDEKGETWPVELCFKKDSNVVHTRKSDWIPFVKEIGLREGDDFEVRIISKGVKPVLAIRRLSRKENGQTSYQNGQNDDELSEPEIEVVSETTKRQKVWEGPAQSGKIVSKPVNKKLVQELSEPEIQSTVTETLPERKTATNDNTGRVNRREQTSHSTSADCSTRFSQTSTWPSIERSRLVVNKDFMMSNGLISKCGHIILKNLKGESWPARLRREEKKTHACYYIGSGWRDFALSNGLGVGCQFKMEIEQPESEVLTFKLCERTPGNLNLEENV